MAWPAEDRRSHIVTGAVALTLLVVGIAVWLYTLSPGGTGGPSSTCGPATSGQIDAAKQSFKAKYLNGDDPDSPIRGVGIGKHGDSYVLLVMLLPGSKPADAPDCFDDVPGLTPSSTSAAL